MANTTRTTRAGIVEDFNVAVEQYTKATKSKVGNDELFDLVRGDLMRIANRAYQLARTEALAPEPAATKADEVPTTTQPTVKELRARARDLDIKGASRMNREDLVAAISATVG